MNCMKLKIIVAFSLLLSLLSCGGPTSTDYNKAVAEVKMLRDSLDLVKKELNAYMYSPSKLCANIDVLYKADSLQSLQNIAAELAKYHPESKELKEVNSMISDIEARRHRIAAEETSKRMRAVDKLKKNYDDVSGITWYQNPYFVHYNNSNLLSMYIGKSEDNVWLRLVMSYEGEDWIFFENAYLSYEGNTREIIFDKFRDKKSDHDTRVWEWIDVSVDEETLGFIQNFANGKSPKMRLTGKYSKTRNISNKEINALKDILLAYDVLKKGI